jgi:hypothetical protein
LLQRIDDRLGALGRSRYWLSMQVTDGRHQGVVRDIERRGSVPSADRLAEMARLLGTTTEYLMGRTADPAPMLSEVTINDRRIEFRGPERDVPGLPLVGTGDCADLEVESDTGELVQIERCSFDPEYHVTYIQRPAVLRGDRDAYAIYFHGDSMAPRFEPGEIGIAQPSRPPAPGEYVIVQLRNGANDEVGSVIVKKLVRQNSREVTLEQFNPPLVFVIPRERVLRMHRLMPPDQTFFV